MTQEGSRKYLFNAIPATEGTELAMEPLVPVELPLHTIKALAEKRGFRTTTPFFPPWTMAVGVTDPDYSYAVVFFQFPDVDGRESVWVLQDKIPAVTRIFMGESEGAME